MDVAAARALRGLIRGLAKAGVFNVGQMHIIYAELEAEAVRLEGRGRHADAEAIRDMIDGSMEP